ncbi:MAG: serine--tRNA ligase [Rickettsiales bacterium]|jgi:seryl-tRNA synthetase|nr:serine--tRNA ligase [Rickettsiales bacterium]
MPTFVGMTTDRVKMIDINIIRSNSEMVKKNAANKGFAPDIDTILKADEKLRALKTETENLIAKKNELSRQIPTSADKAALVAESKKIGEQAEGLQSKLSELESNLNDLLLSVPQIASEDSPIGKDDSENIETKRNGKIREFDFAPRAQYEILDLNKWWAAEKISQICGPRTYCLMGEAAELELAVQTFVIQKLISKGFVFANVPAIVKRQAIFDAGHFPGSDTSIMDNDVFALNVPDKFLAGTAEIVLNSLHAGEILTENQLPIKYAGYSPCFRKEAGAAGKDTRGLIRVHQFHKVEQFIYCAPEEADAMHAYLREILEEVMLDFEIPYRVLSVCTGDMGFNKVRQDDIEAWIPSEQKYRELGSCSTIGEFQARRTNTRYRENATGKVRFCATLNNTGIALPRALVAILENHQNADGSVAVPNKLQPLMGGRKVIGKK